VGFSGYRRMGGFFNGFAQNRFAFLRLTFTKYQVIFGQPLSYS
jgi:hypothetical protein